MMHGRFGPALYSVPASLTPSYVRKTTLRPSICPVTPGSSSEKGSDEADVFFTLRLPPLRLLHYKYLTLKYLTAR